MSADGAVQRGAVNRIEDLEAECLPHRTWRRERQSRLPRTTKWEQEKDARYPELPTSRRFRGRQSLRVGLSLPLRLLCRAKSFEHPLVASIRRLGALL